MKLQLADGYMESPLGVLEEIIVTSCGIEYEHNFAVVDFGKKPNYEIILGSLTEKVGSRQHRRSSIAPRLALP